MSNCYCHTEQRQICTWINLLCIARLNDGILPGTDAIAFHLRMDPSQAEGAIRDLIAGGLLDETDRRLKPHAWDNRQFTSDSSTSRVRKFRSKAKQEGNVSELGSSRTN
jgi:hypothetical protein